MKKSVTYFFLLVLIIGILNSCSALFSPVKHLKVGNVVISSIPKEAIVEYIDESYADRIKELKENNMLVLFTGYSVAGNISKTSGYEKAKMNAQAQISEYLNNKVEVFKKKVDGYISNLNQNNDNADLQEISTTAMKSIQKNFSESKQFGVKEIAKYLVPKNSLTEYYEVLVYDPLALIQVFESSQLINNIQKIGGESKEIFKMLNDVFKEAEK
ncbi:hypothetical protein X275_00680 [Marinitoga sp. 1197]|uniref:hypothetical protein n=1 Tax=Marinitoga sp. 1197 TaxID=1428449 RepID=UPI000641486F|nr:hypothetical protein [Marinitoga sp. 1197]KLO24232.1 hypothetical protein X275_00680 [Marinitoga sp. 1197]